MLSIKQQNFCEYYIELGNATEAAKRAGYSEKTAYSIGTENLKKLRCRINLKNCFCRITARRQAAGLRRRINQN